MEQEDILFGQIAVAMRVLTKDQLRQALAQQQRRPDQRLGEACLSLKLLTSEEIQRILEVQTRRRTQKVAAEKPQGVEPPPQRPRPRPAAESVDVRIDLSQLDLRPPAAEPRRAAAEPRTERSEQPDWPETRPERDAQPPRETRPEREAQPPREAQPGREARPMRDQRPGRDTQPPREAQPGREAQLGREARPMRDQRPEWLEDSPAAALSAEQQRSRDPRADRGGEQSARVDRRGDQPARVDRRDEPGREEPDKTPPSVLAPGATPRIDSSLRRMVELGASDLHLSSQNPPMLRLHGSMRPLDEGQAALTSEELHQQLYEILPERVRAEFENTWDSDFAYAIAGVARFRVNYFMDHKGIGAVFRQIPYEILSPAQIGLPRKVLDLCLLSKGLVLVTGPTGSGKSTTLASLVNHINETRDLHIITIEDPIEFVHLNKKCLVNQREVGAHTQSFKRALRAALREDPDIVLVGEMRDLETVAIALETAETGHLVFGTLHTCSAASTIDRIIDQFPADQQEQIRTMLGESLRGVVAQMLCKRKGGGRVAAYEVLLSTPAVANLIREGKTHQIPSVMQTSKELGMQLLNDHLVELVRTGAVEARDAYLLSYDKASFKTALTRLGVSLNI